MVSCPDHVREALVSHDRRLSIEWNPVRRAWEVLYLRRGFPKPPYTHDSRGIHHSSYAMIHRIEKRNPSLHDVRLVREWDTSNTRASDLLLDMVEHNDKARAYKEQQRADHRKEFFIDPLWQSAMGRTTYGHGGKQEWRMP
jgi:hypothetical protein